MVAGRWAGRRAWLVAAGIGVGVGAPIAAAAWIGLVSAERHVGFFAPVWDRDGRHVYLIQRETRGVTWGAGWEHFTPPAWVYVLSDRFELQRLDSETGRVEVLETHAGSPLQGRVTRHYRGRIFNPVAARVVPGEAGVEFRVKLNVPRVPTSEQWTLGGTWATGQPSRATWASGWGGGTAAPDAVLMGGVELITAPGAESFPAAVLAVEAGGRYRVLRRNADFDALYPGGVPADRIAARSHRERIERGRELRRVEAALVERYRRRGLSEGEALLRARDDMEETGHLPKDPRLVARVVSAPPAGLPVFEIPEEYLRVGLFQDIAAAIAAPGTEVRTGTGTYLKYDGDDLGPRLKAWRDAGNDRFAVRSGERLHLLEVRRFGH